MITVPSLRIQFTTFSVDVLVFPSATPSATPSRPGHRGKHILFVVVCWTFVLVLANRLLCVASLCLFVLDVWKANRFKQVFIHDVMLFLNRVAPLPRAALLNTVAFGRLSSYLPCVGLASAVGRTFISWASLTSFRCRPVPAQVNL